MIETIELTKAYRKVRAVDGLSFTAEPGRVTGFLGLNGSGKTTTLRMLLGLTRPTMFAGFGAFGISALTVSQHYQHRTAALLYLARPKRLHVLIAQVITTVSVSWGVAAVTGITVLTKSGGALPYRHTLVVVPIMAVFGAATAAIVRSASRSSSPGRWPRWRSRCPPWPETYPRTRPSGGAD
jgi:ABC-type hemin transport system ATPase subunit